MFDYDNKEKLADLLNVDMSGCEGDYAEEMAEYLTYKDVVVLPCRCKDCKYIEYYDSEIFECRECFCKYYRNIKVDADGYCYKGERKCDNG